jgi:molybdopterin-guanine dinucleotide biosynthesis protein A
MGCDKSRLPFGPESLVDRQFSLLRALCRSGAIIRPRERFAGTRIQVYEDEISGRGPLGGILAGLRKSRTEFSLFLGCDMPLRDERFLRHLVEQAFASPALTTVAPPCAVGRYPLCALLRRGAMARLGSCLESGQYQVGRFFSRSPRRTISKAEFARAGFSTRIFSNLNTPEEYERMPQQWLQ